MPPSLQTCADALNVWNPVIARLVIPRHCLARYFPVIAGLDPPIGADGQLRASERRRHSGQSMI